MVMLKETLTGKIGYISAMASLFGANCSFEEHSNGKEFFMKRKTSKFVVVHAICSLSPSYKLLINYNFCRPPAARKKFLALVYL
jgi:hypothetical protein